MGHTVATPTHLIDREREAWRRFRRALRQKDRERFDELFAMARRQAHAIGESGCPVAFEAVVMAMLVELVARIEEMERKVAELREGRPGPEDAG